ncbi:hypothetical protein PM082_018841 [Marasmius tenuissimus]|nr:hypothetical protein PM082_018841 [Marasmius tenuissimus]
MSILGISTAIVIYVSSFVLTSALAYYISRWLLPSGSYKNLPLPPGPRGLPIVGNLLDIPTSFLAQNLEKMGKELGELSFPDPFISASLTSLGVFSFSGTQGSDILYLNAAGTKLVVLNSHQACWDLLEKRSGIYSSRPRLPMLHDIIGWNKDFILLPYGNLWKTCRRLFHQEFPLNDSSQHESQVLRVNRTLLRDLLSDPEHYQDHLRQMTGSLIILVTYGLDVKGPNDPVVRTVERAVEMGSQAATPGKFMVDALPILKYVPAWFPGAGFKRKAREWNKLYVEMGTLPFGIAKKQMETETSPPSFVSNRLNKLYDDPNECGYTEQEVMHVASSMYSAGTDTSRTSLLSFILAMTLFPHTQRTAQSEIDRVVGQGRLPEFRDRESLVYVEAILREVQRWQPVVPAAIPHYIHVEDEYRGYRIPKDSTVIGNSWAILHDEEMYPDPYAFKPERWIKDGKINPEIRDITSAFGFGRRICPGRHLAMATIYITAATILAAFDISKPVDENGVEIEPKVEYASTITK